MFYIQNNICNRTGELCHDGVKTKEKKTLTAEVLVTLVVNSPQLLDEKKMNERNHGSFLSDKLVLFLFPRFVI